MMRVRLKADGRLVEVLADGRERMLPPSLAQTPAAAPTDARAKASDASYARRIRSQTRLTQAEFAARIDVPIETVRNWEQGKRSIVNSRSTAWAEGKSLPGGLRRSTKRLPPDAVRR